MHRTFILQVVCLHSILSQRGVPQLWFPLFTKWILLLKDPGEQYVRGAMKIPAKMAVERSGVNRSPLVPFSRHFDVMAL